jgi:hypothetical protein
MRALVEDEELLHTRAPAFLNLTVTGMGTVPSSPIYHLPIPLHFLMSIIDGSVSTSGHTRESIIAFWETLRIHGATLQSLPI